MKARMERGRTQRCYSDTDCKTAYFLYSYIPSHVCFVTLQTDYKHLHGRRPSLYALFRHFPCISKYLTHSTHCNRPLVGPTRRRERKEGGCGGEKLDGSGSMCLLDMVKGY